MKNNIKILDNRNGKADLEIDEFGNGKWYVWNECTDKCIAVPTKQDAMIIKRYSTQYDI